MNTKGSKKRDIRSLFENEESIENSYLDLK